MYINTDTRSIAYNITINNPVEKGFDHLRIRKILFKNFMLKYYCMADETADSGTLHTHIYVKFVLPVRFSDMRRHFTGGHIEEAKADALTNKQYISKSGKYSHSPKGSQKIDGTFEEYGDIPREPYDAKNRYTNNSGNDSLNAFLSRFDTLILLAGGVTVNNEVGRVVTKEELINMLTESTH